MAGDQRLVLDDLGKRLSDFYSLRKTDSSRADEVLNSLGASTEIDRQIVLELAAPKPLWLSDRFMQAHSLVVRALEVLDRNGTRKPPVPRLGPLTPVARYFVGLVTTFIIRSYLATVVDRVYRLYVRREANCLPDDPDRSRLRRARIDFDRLRPGFKRNPLGVPTFLLGGAFISGGLGAMQDALNLFSDSSIFSITATVLLFVVAIAASWVILRGAAVAHRRIELTTEQPLAALWETIGRAGNPPKDHAGALAVIAIVLTVLALLVVPIGLAFTVF